MLPVIPAESPFWPPISCIDRGGWWWIIQAAEAAQVLTDVANVLEQKWFTPTQQPLSAELGKYFLLLLGSLCFLSCWPFDLNCLKCCFWWRFAQITKTSIYRMAQYPVADLQLIYDFFFTHNHVLHEPQVFYLPNSNHNLTSITKFGIILTPKGQNRQYRYKYKYFILFHNYWKVIGE